MKKELRKFDPRISDYRDLFPITRECIYLNHAGTGPMSIPAQNAIAQCVATYSRQAEFDIDDYFRLVKHARSAVARFIKADATEIVLTHNTSEGLLIALLNLPMKPGDTILVMDEVFPAVRYLVDNNLPQINKKYIELLGRDPVDVITAHMHSRVKAVVVDYVQFLSGETIDLRRLGRVCRENDIFLVVDGIQAIGALDYDVQTQDVDFLACGAAKWLFGPSGAGFLYVNKRNFKKMHMLHAGWLGAQWTGFQDFTYDPALYKDARKYELGTRNIMGIRAFHENVNILLKYKMANVQANIQGLKSLLRQHFEDLGYQILTPKSGVQSGIITARPAKGAKELFKRLSARDIIVSLRNGYLRFSPHFYNTDEEVDRVVDAL